MNDSIRGALVRLASLGLLAFSPVACSTTKDSAEIEGNVTWSGQPLDHGFIMFFPEDPHTTPASAKISRGQYHLTMKPGKMRVEIEAVRDTGRVDPHDNSPLGEMYIPPKYNSRSELTAEVSLNGTNQFNFQLDP